MGWYGEGFVDTDCMKAEARVCWCHLTLERLFWVVQTGPGYMTSIVCEK